MKRLYLLSLPGLCLVMLGVLLLRAGNASAASAPAPASSCGQWTYVKSPSPNTNFNILYGVVTLSPDNVWAVGDSTNVQDYRPSLIEHWNGKRWSIVASPNPSSHTNQLNSIVAISANDIWAVGLYGNLLTGIFHPFIVHWDGTSWKLISTQSQAGLLYSATAVSATNIWAVGYDKPRGKTVIDHWDGNQWSIVASPNHYARTNILQGVTALSASDIWAVGYFENFDRTDDTLVEHWDGSTWSLVKSSNPAPGIDEFNGVTVISATDIWAVGQQGSLPLIEHWDGSQWHLVHSPFIFFSILNAVTAISTSNVWAVGLGTVKQKDHVVSLIEHWNGSSWSQVHGANFQQDNVLRSVAQVPGTNTLWSVGNLDTSSSSSNTLTEVYC